MNLKYNSVKYCSIKLQYVEVINNCSVHTVGHVHFFVDRVLIETI